MYLTTVVPVHARSPERLTYLSRTPLSKGTLVSVPFGKQTVSAFVISSVSALENKAALRRSSVTLKKINSPESNPLSSAALRAIAHTARDNALTLPETLARLIPETILTRQQAPILATLTPPNVLTYEGADLSPLLALIDYAHAHGALAQVVVPTQARAKDIVSFLKEKNLSAHLVTHKKYSEKSTLITTPLGLLAHRSGTGLLIICDEGSERYIDLILNIDLRLFVAEYARLAGIPLARMGAPLSLATERTLIEQELFCTRTPLLPILPTLVTPQKNEGLFPIAVAKQWQKTLTSGARTLLYAPRTGLGTHTICNDCKTPHLCPLCDHPFSLREQGGTRMFSCRFCGHSEDSKQYCKVCGSWHLASFGISTRSILDALIEPPYSFDSSKISVIDGDMKASEVTEAKRHVENGTTPLLIANQKIFSTDLDTFDSITIVSLDSLLSLPSLTIDEHIWHTVVRLAGMTQNPLTLISRLPEHPTVLSLTKGDRAESVANELIIRKQFGLPPYARHIEIKRSHEILPGEFKDLCTTLAVNPSLQKDTCTFPLAPDIDRALPSKLALQLRTLRSKGAHVRIY